MGSRASPRDRRYGLKGCIARIKDRQHLLRYSKVSLMCAVRVSRIRVSRSRIKEPRGRLNQRASSIGSESKLAAVVLELGSAN